MKNQPSERKIDLKYLFFLFYSKWYYFAATLVVVLFAAYIYNKTSDRIYVTSAKVMMESQRKGSSGADELLQIIEVKDKNIKVDDEIGRITSFSMVQKTMQNLDFGVAYFKVPNSWINTFGNRLVEEKSAQDFPFKIVLNPSANQIINTPIYVKILSKNKFQVEVDGEKVYLYNIENNTTVPQPIPEVKISKTASMETPYDDKYLNFKLVLNKPIEEIEDATYYFTIRSLESLTKEYVSKLTAKPLVRDSRIVELGTTGRVMDKEISFLNKLIDVYIDESLKDKSTVGTETIYFIDSQLADVTDSLRRAELAMEDFRKSIRGVDSEYTKYNVFDKLDRLNEEKAIVANRLKDYNYMLNYFQSNQDEANNVAPSATGLENNVLVNQYNKLTELYQQKSKLGYSAKMKSPQLEMLDTQIANTRSTIMENLRSAIRTSNTEIARIDQRIAELETNVSRLPENERRLVDLRRKFLYNEETHNFYVQKRAEAAIALATNTPDMRVIDAAKPVSDLPISPKTNAIFLIAFLVGLFIPAGSIALADFMDDTIKTKEDLKQVTNIPVLGMIAHSNTNTSGYMAKGDGYKSVVSESFRSLRVNLQYLAVGMEQKAIGITSSLSGEGKTFCSINLATVLALSGKRVIVIDADMRKPRIAQYMDLKNTFGLSSYLIKNNTLEEVIQPSKVKNFDIITSGPIPPNPIELLELREMRELINRLKSAYDYVIVDTPPLGLVSEYMVLKQYMDVNLYVVRSNFTKRKVLEQVNELYENRAIENLSIVINDVKFSSTYGYTYKAKAKEYGYV